jgi:hypothetical protein
MTSTPEAKEIVDTLGDLIFGKSHSYATQLTSCQTWDRLTDLIRRTAKSQDLVDAFEDVSKFGWKDLKEYADEEGLS